MLPNQTGFDVSIYNQHGRLLGHALDADLVKATKLANGAADKELSTANMLWKWRKASAKTIPWFKSIE